MSAAKGRLITGLGCVLVALFSGLNNLGEFIFMLIGPEALQQMQNGYGGWMQNDLAAYVAAMDNGVFRWGLFVAGGVGCLAAFVLLLGGLALIAGQQVSRPLLSAWGLYGVVAGPVIAVLTTRYLLPEVAAVQGEVLSDGAMLFRGLGTLVMLWVLPVGLLLLLRLPYMHLQPTDGRTEPQAAPPPQLRGNDSADAVEHGPRQAKPDSYRPTDRSRSDPASDPLGASTMLRDDPWNDPEAT